MRPQQVGRIIRKRLERLACDLPPRWRAVLNMEALAVEAVIPDLIRIKESNEERQGKTLIEVFADEDATAEIARLHELIDDQPHAKSCRWVLGQDDKCSCWKAEARSGDR